MLRFGTSGWQYRHWRGRFYPARLAARQWLEYYAQHFATVEVNNTFYRLPEVSTFTGWAARVPPDFVFSLKASRYLTHFTRLRAPNEPVARLLARAAPLARHLGPVLVQLPPDMQAAPELLDATLRAFGRVRVAVEVRHTSWFCEEVQSVLTAHDAALCLVDRGSRTVTPSWRTASWAYVRLHEGRAHPSPCYGTSALRSWAARLRDMYGREVDGYVYFNNDGRGCALRDAIAFGRAARAAGLRVPPVPLGVDVDVG